MNARSLRALTNVKTLAQLYDKENEVKGMMIIIINTGAGRSSLEMMGGGGVGPDVHQKPHAPASIRTGGMS